MSSEWMKVMLDEIARKKLEASDALMELERRRREQGPPASLETATPPSAAAGIAPPGKTPGGRPPE